MVRFGLLTKARVRQMVRATAAGRQDPVGVMPGGKNFVDADAGKGKSVFGGYRSACPRCRRNARA